MKTSYFKIITNLGFDRTLKIVACILLVAILIVQILILQKMPPTVGDFQNVKKIAAYQKLLSKQPIVHIPETLKVDVQNIPLEVEVYR